MSLPFARLHRFHVPRTFPDHGINRKVGKAGNAESNLLKHEMAMWTSTSDRGSRARACCLNRSPSSSRPSASCSDPYCSSVSVWSGLISRARRRPFARARTHDAALYRAVAIPRDCRCPGDPNRDGSVEGVQRNEKAGAVFENAPGCLSQWNRHSCLCSFKRGIAHRQECLFHSLFEPVLVDPQALDLRLERGSRHSKLPSCPRRP